MLTLIGIGLAAFVLEGPWRWVAIAVGATLDTAENAVLWWWSRRRRPQVGVERLRGATAVVLTPCRPLGQVRVAGEVWRAECPEAPTRARRSRSSRRRAHADADRQRPAPMSEPTTAITAPPSDTARATSRSWSEEPPPDPRERHELERDDDIAAVITAAP
jgi:hypothetical protein